jgi:hypothetical protein
MRAIQTYSTKPFSKEDKRDAVEIWKAWVPLDTQQEAVQDGVRRTLHRFLAFAKVNPDSGGQKMADSDSLKKLMEWMVSRLLLVIESGGVCTKY